MNLTTSFQKLGEVVIGNAGYGNYLLRLYGRYTSQSISSNTTTVEYQIRHYIPVGGVTYWSSSQRFTGDITNSSSNAQNQSFGAGETTLLTATKTITHNNDGTKNISVGASFTNSYFGNTVSISNVTVTLPRIARASSVSSSSPYIGDVATIVIASASTSFTHTLSYAFGNATGTIVTKTSATTVAWDTSSLKSTLYAQIPNAKSGSGTITCQTYSGNTLIGTKTTNFNLYAKESECKPNISGTVVDTNEATITLTGDSSKLVRYMSKPKVTISSSANYSASIKSYSINVDGKTINLSEATFETITSNNITISVVDSRGYSSYEVLTPTMIDYIKLTSNLSITRPEQTSNEARLNGDGQWFNGNFSDINTNTLTITCQYRKSGDEEWIDLNQLTPNINNNYFNFHNVLIGDTFDYKEEYQFKIIINDELDTIGNESKDIIILSVGIPIVRIGKNDVFVKMKPIDASVSLNSTEPTKSQDIWLQKGKNLFIGGIYNSSANRLRFNNYFCLEGGKTYTINAQGSNIQVYMEFLNATSNRIETTSWSDFPFTFTANTNAKYADIYFRFADNSNIAPTNVSNIQIEQGETATSYEAYIDKKIYTRNDNGVYEEFNSAIVDSGSNSNGSWVKFADGTMICTVDMAVTNQAINTKYGDTALYYGVRDWTFPQPFAEVKSVTCGCFKWGTSGSWGGNNGYNSDYATLMGYDFYPRATGTNCRINALAIGKWK